MPTALVLILRPLELACVDAYLGRASHAAFLHTISKHNRGLAQQLHDLQMVKPFAVSDLLDAPFGDDSLDAPFGDDSRMLHPERTYLLRWCGLSSELENLLQTVADAPPTMIRLAHVRFAIEHATSDSTIHSWAGTASWSDLRPLEQKQHEQPPDRFTLHFVTPTTFRSNKHNTKRNIPLPLPELIFGSLVDRWNSVAPTTRTLPPDVRQFAADHLVIGRYSLQSTRVTNFGEGETAFTGRCTFIAKNRDRNYLHYCAALLRFARFCGIGAKASMGLGMVRLEEQGRRH
jgi:CRISPR-associated endoribonuclease Cas6